MGTGGDRGATHVLHGATFPAATPNDATAVALHTPAFGNACANGGDGGAEAVGAATNSPGVVSGNEVQGPVDVPVIVCGNSVNVVGLLNPVFGNECV
ncbi:chaplin, partial [Streptomyces sp. JV186]|uniref:chaplin n=1 Tax=Streptomyces sp. JV186 TaxID=858639 RepID=UPI003FA707BB